MVHRLLYHSTLGFRVIKKKKKRLGMHLLSHGLLSLPRRQDTQTSKPQRFVKRVVTTFFLVVTLTNTEPFVSLLFFFSLSIWGVVAHAIHSHAQLCRVHACRVTSLIRNRPPPRTTI